MLSFITTLFLQAVLWLLANLHFKFDFFHDVQKKQKGVNPEIRQAASA